MPGGPYDGGSFSEQLALLFRDFLRVDRRAADEYAAVKRALAERHRDDRRAYTGAKAPTNGRSGPGGSQDPATREALGRRRGEVGPAPFAVPHGAPLSGPDVG